jgi:outer membrane protein assembly factor BamD (BamD/ComL family)
VPAISLARPTALAALTVLLAVCLCAGLAAGQDGKMLWDGEKWVPAAAPEPGTAMGDLASIRQDVDAGRVKTIIDRVEQFLVQYPQSPGCEEAMNLAGQALIKRGRYWKAYDWYTRQISTYPNGAFFQRALDRQYMIADAFLKGRKRRLWGIFRIGVQDDAIDMLQRIAAAAPGTELAERSLLRVADHYFDNGLFKEAIDIYEQFIRENPSSPRRAYAMLQVPKSYLLSYKGVEWDVAPLLNAKKRFEIFAAAYPRAAKRENVATILEEIRRIRAHKLYHIGWFYERTKHPRAAAYYYQQLLDTEDQRGVRIFADTQWAEQARQRLAMIGPVEPAEPAPRSDRRDKATDDRIEKRQAEDSASPSVTLPPGEPPRLSTELGRRRDVVVDEPPAMPASGAQSPVPDEEPIDDDKVDETSDVEGPTRLEALPVPPQ